MCDWNWIDLVMAQVSLAAERLRKAGRIDDAKVLAGLFAHPYAAKRLAVAKRKAWRKLCEV